MDARTALPNYFSIVGGKSLPLYLRAKRVEVEFDPLGPEEKLWDVHREGLRALRDGDLSDRPSQSLFDLKMELTSRLLNPCNLCERRCKVNRRERAGFCKVRNSKVASRFVHWGEEPELIPSYTIFFSGCTFSCVFCQNWDISHFEKGLEIPPLSLAIDLESKSGKVRNVNWVGGEPTFNLPYILQVLKDSNASLAQVWNSNMYMTEKVMEILDGLMDLYLADFKYGNDRCAGRLSRVPNYWEVVSRNHRIANNQTEMVLRHLVMPNHLECCTKPILDWIADNLDTSRVRVNVMDQYRPEFKAREYESISRTLHPEEFREAWRYAQSLGLNLV